MSTALFKKVGSLFGLSPNRSFPRMARQSLTTLVRDLIDQGVPDHRSVLFLSDAFTDYFYPGVGLSAVRLLNSAGYRVHLLPVSGAGRTLISKGFLVAASAHAKRLVDAIWQLDPEGKLPIVGVEPSEVLTLRDEYLDLFQGERDMNRIDAIASRSYCIDEFLIRPGEDGEARIFRIANQIQSKDSQRVLLHGHCYQKAQPPAPDGYPSGVAATISMLQAAGYQVELVDSGCCGMAGAFGYEAEHYELSMKVGELGLFPAIRKAGRDTIIAAAGVSCQAQIQDGAQREAVHPITLLDSRPIH